MVPLAEVEKLKNSDVRRATFSAARRQNLHEPENPLSEDEMRDFRTLFESSRWRTRYQKYLFCPVSASSCAPSTSWSEAGRPNVIRFRPPILALPLRPRCQRVPRTE